LSRMAYFMSTITDELAEELSQLDEIQVRVYLFQIGEVISWIGHGDNTRLPETLRELAEQINPTGAGNADSGAESGSHLGIGSEAR